MGPNPFWTRRAIEEFRLQAARPVDLPIPQDGDLEDVLPIEGRVLNFKWSSADPGAGGELFATSIGAAAEELHVELEALRRAKGGGSQATWSWMEVSEGFPRGKMQTRRHESKMDWEVVRFTPNSAQIPPPPLEPSLSVQMLAWDLQAYDIIGSETSYEVVGATTTTSGREAAWEGGRECRGGIKFLGELLAIPTCTKRRRRRSRMEWNGMDALMERNKQRTSCYLCKPPWIVRGKTKRQEHFAQHSHVAIGLQAKRARWWSSR